MKQPSRRSRGSATIQDVARTAGVSPMTVSRVINGEKNVRPATREAVMDAARRLNYAPNPAARSLAGRQATHIGLLYANPSAAYLSSFLVAALDGCRRTGCQLVVGGCGDSEAEQRAGAQRLVDDNVDGVILPVPLAEVAHVRAVFAAADIPIVTVAVGDTPAWAPNVRIDDFAAAFDMTLHLLDAGHRRIGFIRGHPNQSASDRRYLGFAEALRSAGLDPAKAPVEQGYFSYRSGMEAAERLLAPRARPTAVFASNDDMAAAAVNVAHRHGLEVPGDLSIVGFDDTSAATSTWPELTTVRQPVDAMVESALELLLAALRAQRSGEPAPPLERVLPHELVERESVAPPRAARRRA